MGRSRGDITFPLLAIIVTTHWTRVIGAMVNEDLLVGRAVFVWLSLEFERSQQSWLPSWVPSRGRFDRLREEFSEFNRN